MFESYRVLEAEIFYLPEFHIFLTSHFLVGLNDLLPLFGCYQSLASSFWNQRVPLELLALTNHQNEQARRPLIISRRSSEGTSGLHDAPQALC